MLKKFAKGKAKIEETQEESDAPKVSYPTLFVRNSFCTLAGFPTHIMDMVKELLTYEDESVKHEIKKCYGLIEYYKSKGKKYVRTMYAMRSKLEHLKKRQVVCWLKGGRFPTGHLPMVKELLETVRFNDWKLEDVRLLPSHSAIFRWRNKPFDPHYYQADMIELAPIHGRGVFESAVGTGKSLILTYIIKNLGVNSLIVVPSSGLQEQLGRSLRLAFGDNMVSDLDTPSIKKGKKLAPVRITTVQTLASLQKQGLLREAIQDVDLVAVDEIHHAGAESYTSLLPELDHIYYRFGFTGTFLRNDSRTLDMWGFLSNRLYHYPPYKATKEGFLTPVEMHIERLPGVSNRDYQKEYDANYCVKTERGKTKGAEELMAAILRRIQQIPENEQILILVDRKDNSGKFIHEFLKNAGLDNSYISGDDKRDVIADTIESYNKKEIRILVGSTVIGEGIDVHSSQHLILANGGKSPIKLVQAIGRCVRLHPGKLKSYVYDFCFEGTCYLEKHCGQRIDVFANHFDGKVVWLS